MSLSVAWKGPGEEPPNCRDPVMPVTSAMTGLVFSLAASFEGLVDVGKIVFLSATLTWERSRKSKREDDGDDCEGFHF